MFFTFSLQGADLVSGLKPPASFRLVKNCGQLHGFGHCPWGSCELRGVEENVAKI